MTPSSFLLPPPDETPPYISRIDPNNVSHNSVRYPISALECIPNIYGDSTGNFSSMNFL